MPKKSAGILLFRSNNNLLEVLLVHPGGPFWKKKDMGVWSIPKGEFEAEDPLEAAKREFKEEIGTGASGEFIELRPLKQKSGKIIYAWALQGDLDPADIESNLFEMEWPYRSGKQEYFPEIDRAEWFPMKKARQKITPGQLGFLDQLNELVVLILLLFNLKSFYLVR